LYAAYTGCSKLTRDTTTFDCLHLQNAWTNLHDFRHTSTTFCSEHNS